jgi:hypothetical protein
VNNINCLIPKTSTKPIEEFLMISKVTLICSVAKPLHSSDREPFLRYRLIVPLQGLIMDWGLGDLQTSQPLHLQDYQASLRAKCSDELFIALSISSILLNLTGIKKLVTNSLIIKLI